MLAQEYKQQLAQSNYEPEPPLWEREPWNCNVELIEQDGELSIRFEDGSVFDYETRGIYTAEQWAKVEALGEEVEEQGEIETYEVVGVLNGAVR